MSVSIDYSGIVFTQNSGKTKKGTVDLNLDIAYDWHYQEFQLPDDYSRGHANDLTPPLTGISVMVGIESGYAHTAAMDYTIERLGAGGWETLIDDLALGAHADGGQVWFDIYFHKPVEIEDAWLTDTFRFGIRAREHHDVEVKNVEVPYAAGKGNFWWNGKRYERWLDEGETWPFSDDVGINYVVYREPGTGSVYVSHQKGIKWLWYSAGQPFKWATTYKVNGIPLKDGGQDVAFRFRLLAGVADTGEDILGNQERHVITEKKTANIDTFEDKRDFEFWMSKPNPSKFAVESLYFDMRDGSGSGQVIDRLLLDPLTKDVYFHIYYSNEGEPADAERDWERKLWTRVPRTFKMNRRETHALPEPVTARYVKLEFSHLKPEAYDPGEFPQRIYYKKHPKWVFNYFLARYESDKVSEDRFVASRVGIRYNALKLAYNYYLDDLAQEPESPLALEPDANEGFLTQFLVDQSDAADQVDAETLSRIRIAFTPFQNHPVSFAPVDSILGLYNTTASTPYPIESVSSTRADTTNVSTLRRERVIFEQTHPVMFFYVTARHNYKMVAANLTHDRAYFVGIRELAFTRDDYTSKYDNPLYIESVGDNVNVERNDFVSDPLTFEWVTH